jgi:hypothetical protein
MKKFLALFFLTVVSALAQAEKIDLGSRGKLTIYLTDEWKFDISDFGDRRIVKMVPKSEKVNADAELTIVFPETDRFDTKARLQMRVEIDSVRYSEVSVEGKARAKEMNLSSGWGYICTFTDPDLIGKPSKKGDFKNIAIGKIRLAADVVIEFVIQADGLNSEPYNQLLGAIEGMEFIKKK